MTNPTGLPPETAEAGALRITDRAAADLAPPSPPGDPAILMASQNLAHCAAPFDESLTPAAMRAALERVLIVDGEGRDTLFMQAQLLDALFYRLTAKALTATDGAGAPVADYVNDARIDLALRAQRQCRTTFDSLHRIKNTNKQKDS